MQTVHQMAPARMRKRSKFTSVVRSKSTLSMMTSLRLNLLSWKVRKLLCRDWGLRSAATVRAQRVRAAPRGQK